MGTFLDSCVLLESIFDRCACVSNIQCSAKSQDTTKQAISMAIPKRINIKNNPPLRPIVSRVGTVTYYVAKRLKVLIATFMQKRHMIDSTKQFIEIVKTVKQPKLFASLDAESLFANVPINDT